MKPVTIPAPRWSILILRTVLRGRIEFSSYFGRPLILCLLAIGTAISADPPIVPLSVCEVLRDLPAEEGKTLAVVGRYSFRGNGRWIGEQSCDPPLSSAESPAQLWLVEDAKDAPKPPGDFELDAPSLNKKFTEVRHHTTLGKFRFGTPDYDRWAVIYGRVEARKGDDAKKAPANLVFRGDGVIIFLNIE